MSWKRNCYSSLVFTLPEYFALTILIGLELNKELFVYDVVIEINGKKYDIHTYRCGDGNAEDLVLLHGYAGSSIMYYKMLKQLSKKFRVFCIDFIGMGLSSKTKFECTNTDETIDFIVTSIDKWREAVGLNTFFLAGHSFGGYLSGQYALAHQDKVKKLILLSPVGFTKHEEETRIEDIKKRLGFFKGLLFGFFMKVWENKTTPTTFVKNHPWIASYFIKNYVYKRFHMQDPEAGLLKEFLLKMLNLPEGAEVSIHYVLKPPRAQAHYPLEGLVAEKLTIPVDCFFGDVDYMDTTGAKRLAQSRRKPNFVLKVIPNAAHQLTMQNPEKLSEEIIVSVYEALFYKSNIIEQNLASAV